MSVPCSARAQLNDDKLYRRHQNELVHVEVLPPLSAECNFAPPQPAADTRSTIAAVSLTSTYGGTNGRPNTNAFAPGEGPVAVLGGALAGAVSCCVTNPLDTLRVRLAASRDATGAAHKSIVGHLRILFAGGVADAVGKGLLINIMASSPCNAVYLATYRYLSKRLAEPLLWQPLPAAAAAYDGGGSATTGSDVNSRPDGEVVKVAGSEDHHAAARPFILSPYLVPIVAATGGVILAQGGLCPLLVIRTRVQIDPSRTALQYTRIIYAESGVRGFYRGVATNVAGRAAEEGVFWCVYEWLRRTTRHG